jgi:DNA-binding NarL/FixJ family response regulator
MTGSPRHFRRPTTREKHVLIELKKGSTNKEIAQSLGCSVKTVESHIRNLFDKLGVRTRAGLVGAVSADEWVQHSQ